jgi:hypothetical protein
MDDIAEAFRKRWQHVHEMTAAFATGVSDAHWERSPHPGFAPFNKQLRHVVCVRGVYNEGLRNGRVDFSRKHEHYTGGLTRDELMAGLDAQNVALTQLLDRLEDLPPAVDVFGRQESRAEYLYVYVQHEAIHHGQWSFYAAQGGFAVPDLWRVQWGLEAGDV